MKAYIKIDEKQAAIEALQAAGVKVTATQGEIHEIEIPNEMDIKDIEQQTGLKFKEKI